MNWLWPIGIGLFAVAAGGLFLAFRNPAFVAGLSAVAVKAAWEYLKPTLTKRNTSEIEEKMQQATRQGQEWDNFRKRPRDGR